MFWRAAHELDLEVVDESGLPGVREGHLAELFDAAGLRDIAATALTVSREHPSFDDWWEPYTLGVGPAGAFVASWTRATAPSFASECRALLPEAPFTLTARAWTARARV